MPVEADTTKTLCELFRTSAEQHPDKVLVHHLGRDWTYAEIWASSASLAGWLRTDGLQNGDRVGLLVPNSAQYVICYFGVLMAGGVVVALNPDTTARELAHTLVDCRPSAVVTVPSCEKHLQAVADQLRSVRSVILLSDHRSESPVNGVQVAAFFEVLNHPPLDWSAGDVDASRVAQIIYTSGTTGRPKGVALSHRNLVANCRSITQYLELKASDSVLVILPFFYSYGNSLLLTHAAVGGRLILASDFVFWNRALDLMEQQQATGFAGVPSTYAMLLHKSNFGKRSFPDLRYLTCAGGAMTPAMIEQIRPRLPHVRIFPMYGQTEAAARLSTLLPEELDERPGSIGRGIPGVELSVLDESGRPVSVGEVGEIVAVGENVMLGYWNDPEATRQVLRDGKLWTGDLAHVDQHGYIYIVGRRSDIIKSGAYRINPQEIEEVILEMEGVADVAVVGAADDILGEVAVAFVIRSAGFDGVAQESIIKYCQRILPRYKQVRRVDFVDSIPRTPSGKVKRHELQNCRISSSCSSIR